MNAERFTVQAPGKLFVAGEYAITEPNHEGLVVAVDRYLSVDIQRNRSNRLDLPELKLTDIRWQVEENKVVFSVKDERLLFIKHVIETFIAYAEEHLPVHIVVTSELDDVSGKKFGLGSSAALSVALITALLKFSNRSETINDAEIIYKLAAIAHFKAQGNGSCADIAASTYGGLLNYQAFDREWLVQVLAEGQSVNELLATDWPGLNITPLKPFEQLHFLVGWTQQTAQTAPMVERVQQLKIDQPKSYQAFLQRSQQAVLQIVSGLQQADSELFFAGIKANRHALKDIGIEAGVAIETPRLTDLIDIASPFGAAKTSGAGGGDCGIAFIEQQTDRKTIDQLWREAGIEPLDIQVSQTGVKLF